MIDIHNHSLYKLDDGSRSIEESINILKKAIDNGYTDIILTPHYRKKQFFTCNNMEKYKRYLELKEEVEKQNLKINIHLGNEITVDEDLFYYLNAKEAMPLNGSRYVLIELPFDYKYKGLDEVVDRLLEKGNVPIIAHPERYRYYNDLSEFDKLLRKGVLFQGNIGSLFGKYGSKVQKRLEEMLKRNMIYFMGTDIHYETQTSFDLSSNAYKIVEELTRSKEMADDLFTNNARKVINDEEIEPYAIFKKKYRFKFFNLGDLGLNK